MWFKIALCLFVGIALASNSNPAWKDNTEYVYKVRGHTLASLHEVSNQYSGILLKAKLAIQPRQQGKLYARLSETQYGQVHTELSEGWNTRIPDSEVSYKPLPMSDKNFEIVMRNGVIRDIVVDKEVKNWEANIIKSIVSQFQLDTRAQNLVPSHVNALPEEHDNGVFKTMEETVTGKTETLYDIHELPEYVLESKPWLAPEQHLRGDGKVFEIVKSKNYTDSEQRPEYHFGLSDMQNWEPAANQMGEIFTRSSNSRAYITGNLNRYTIQNSYTSNKIIMSPTLDNQQKGSVISMLNVTLSEVRQQGEKLQGVSNPISLGSLVYRFNKPYSSNNLARPQQQGQNQENSSEEQESWESRLSSPGLGRFRRSVAQELRAEEEQHEQIEKRTWEQLWANQQEQDEPKMDQPPQTPFMPYTTGYKGQALKSEKNFNIVERVTKIAREIGQECQNVDATLEKFVLSKFTILVDLIRTMNTEELKQASEKMYTNNKEEQKQDSWVALRDAVSQAGTGPAFRIIKEWIENKKIQQEEAAEVIANMARNVRVPTEEYMREFFQLITKEEVKSQRQLYETALLSYTNLLRRVYVNEKVSHSEFPVHVYGRFNTQEGKQFLKETVIPQLAKELKQAVAQADNQKIHLYIRALGNIAHREVLAVFEPFLEGKKQVSQFQRMLMVIAMDKLVKVDPVLARSVLYKVYQNAGEGSEIRAAAVYQLMHTVPPTDMLQRMAQNTNEDDQDIVNAAVKSAIESAATLEGAECEQLRSSARAAKPLLTKKSFGVRNAYIQLRSYLIDELKLTSKHAVQTVSGEGSFIPKILQYTAVSTIQGLRQELLNVQSMVSSLDELTSVLGKQTKSHQKAQQQAENTEEHKWSSQNIAGLLNMQSEENEQLEGLLQAEIGNMQKMLSFDNHTIEKLPEMIGEIEEVLKQGKSFHYTKFIDANEYVLSFPTATGFPFVYQYRTPMLIKVQGKLQASSEPQVASDSKLNKPEMIKATSEVRVTVHGKTQGRLSFVTPFDHQQYAAGYDKVLLAHVPIRAQVEIDVKKMQIRAELEPISQQNERVLHYSSTPFTSQSDLLELQPLAAKKTTQIISQKAQQGFDEVYGKRETGMAFRVKMHYEQQMVDPLWLSKLQQSRASFATLMALFTNGGLEHRTLNVIYLPEESSIKEVSFRMGYKQEYRTEAKNEKDEHKADDLKHVAETPAESKARQEDFITKAGAGIKNVHIQAIDADVEFKGQQKIKYTLTGAVAKSNVDPKSRTLVLYKKHADQPFEIVLVAKSHIKNTNGLDLSDALKMEPEMKTEIKLAFGKGSGESSKIQAKIDYSRSEERKQFLLTEPMYHQCKREMQQGNYQLPACANMTISANRLDQINVKIHHENLGHKLSRAARTVYDMIRANFYPTLEVKEFNGESNHINVNARFAPNLRAVNVSIKAHDEESIIKNIHVNDWAQTLLVPHPVFHLPARVQGKLLGNQLYRQICVVDKNEANTFNNNTYPIAIGNKWTVMMQYVRQMARQHQQSYQSVQEQLKHQLENYVVLVRDNAENSQQKEIKITFNTPETEGKVFEISMTPASKNPADKSGSNPSAKVMVNGQQVKFNDKKSHDIKGDLVQIYALPNGEVKVEIRDAFYVIFDGVRAKLTSRNGKFRDSIRGLCGQFNEEDSNDFVTSDNCVVRDTRDFVESYRVEGNQQKQRKQCFQKEVIYTNVISGLDSGRQQQEKSGRNDMCTKYQTRYVKQHGEVCFSLRPLPVCKCQQRGTITKNVAVHCVGNKNNSNGVAQLWMNQINKGASPDFSQKSQTGTVQMELPKECSN